MEENDEEEGNDEELHRMAGFWRSVRRIPPKELLLSWEIWSGLLVGLVSSYALLVVTDVATRHEVAGDYLELTPALLGVTFAALALVVAFLSDSYLKHLDASKNGILAFLDPFMFLIGLQVGSLLLVIGYRAFAKSVPELVENIGFMLITVLFLVSTLEIISLVRSVMLHGVARAKSSRMH